MVRKKIDYYKSIGIKLLMECRIEVCNAIQRGCRGGMIPQKQVLRVSTCDATYDDSLIGTSGDEIKCAEDNRVVRRKRSQWHEDNH